MSDQMRSLRPEELASIMSLYDVSPEDDFVGAGGQRNALRHATSLGLLLVAAVIGDGSDIDPRGVVDLVLSRLGWERGEIDGFLDQDRPARAAGLNTGALECDWNTGIKEKEENADS